MEQNPSPYKRLFLAGEYDALLDDKNRILVCAAFRKEILDCGYDSGLICRADLNRVVRLYPATYYRDEFGQRKPTLEENEEQQRYNDKYYGMVFPLNWDAQGRVGIPDRIIKRALMGRELALVGTNDHVAVWSREDWERRVQSLS